ncbi:hypothetical protein D920_00031 [Enterococcus faecalis 13-SD-W-01]|nr:hypothetical protein D920_00031 [Enterococcus faecalis 13-SD-W-01]
MKSRLLWLLFFWWILVFSACSLRELNEVFGYTYNEYNKLLTANLGLHEKVLTITKYEQNNQEYYLLAFNDDFEGGIKKTRYYKADSNYIEGHKMYDRGTSEGYFRYKKPVMDKVIEEYKVTDNHKFEKVDSE